MKHLIEICARTVGTLRFCFFPVFRKQLVALSLAVGTLHFLPAQSHTAAAIVPEINFVGWLVCTLLVITLCRVAWLLRIHKSKEARLSKEKALLTSEKDTQQRFYANFIHEVIKGEAQCMLSEVGQDIPMREHLTEFVKTCELGQSFVDQHNNDLHDFMQNMQFIFSNRLHSELQERYFCCKIDPSLRGIALNCQQKYELTFFLRECLNNIRKYAHYKHVSLHIFRERNNSAIILEIKDDGIGLHRTLNLAEPDFEINETNYSQFYENHLQKERCTGIREIFHKAERMKGKLTIRPNDSQGTAIWLRFYPN